MLRRLLLALAVGMGVIPSAQPQLDPTIGQQFQAELKKLRETDDCKAALPAFALLDKAVLRFLNETDGLPESEPSLERLFDKLYTRPEDSPWRGADPQFVRLDDAPKPLEFAVSYNVWPWGSATNIKHSVRIIGRNGPREPFRVIATSERHLDLLSQPIRNSRHSERPCALQNEIELQTIGDHTVTLRSSFNVWRSYVEGIGPGGYWIGGRGIDWVWNRATRTLTAENNELYCLNFRCPDSDD